MSDKKNDAPAVVEQPKKSTESGKRRGLTVFSMAILVILLVTFVVGPALTGTSRGGAVVFGSYDGREIAFVPGNYFSQQRDSLGQQVAESGRAVDDSVMYQIWRTAFNRTVFHMAVLSLAGKNGIRVSSDAIDAAISRNPRFMEDGRFSAERFRAISSAELFTLRNLTEDALVQERVVDVVLRSSVESEPELAFLKEMAGPERRFAVARFDLASYPASEVVLFGTTNADIFRRMNLSRISLRGSREEADEIRRRAVERTTSFEDLARSHSVDMYAETGGSMGWVYYYDMLPELGSAIELDSVFDLAAGEISEVFETAGGWSIYLVNEPAETPDFMNEEVQAAVRMYMNSYERGMIEDYQFAQAQRFVESPSAVTDFEVTAAQFGGEVVATEFFPINYGDVPFLSRVTLADEGGQLANASTREPFFEQAFSVTIDSVSEPIVLSDAVVVLKLLEERQPEESSLSFLDFYIPYVLEQFLSESIDSAIVQPGEITDRFNETYFQYVAP